ncbi:MAG TPA: cytochrome c oxidase subunit II [Gemmatimonadaceae bacterium]
MTSPINVLRGAGPVAAMQAKLGWWLMTMSALVVVVVGVLVLTTAFRRRDERRDVLARSGSGLPWVIVGGMIIPGIVLTLTLAFTLATEYASAAPPSDPAVTVQIIGHRWWWEVKYSSDPSHTVVTANEIHIPVGEPVRIELTSADVIHSFWIPQLAGKTDVIPGQRNVTWLQADSAGVYRGPCTEYCGLQHANMVAFVVAEPPAQFAQWLESQSRPAVSPGDPDAAAGEAVFQKSACSMCHAIRGSDALGHVGPDLTHLASRLTIGAGVLENTRGNLAGWIANTQAIKPGNDMPTMTLSPASLQALLSYLETLK